MYILHTLFTSYTRKNQGDGERWTRFTVCNMCFGDK